MGTSVKTQIAAIACGLAIGVASQVSAISVTTEDDASVLASNIEGTGITISNEVYTGHAEASGTFSGAFGAIGIDSGIILTTGLAIEAEGSNQNPNDTGGIGDDTSTDHNLPGDLDLNELLDDPTDFSFDPAILEFDFETTSAGILAFNYVFGSEEYDEFVDDGFNDIFGFFLTELGDPIDPLTDNLALVPGTSDIVSIDTVNGVDTPTLYNSNNNPANFDIEYDGFTDVFTATSPNVLDPGMYHIKLAIADGGDRILDSAVFIQAGSFSVTPPVTAAPLPAAVWVGASLLGGLGLFRLTQHKRPQQG